MTSPTANTSAPATTSLHNSVTGISQTDPKAVTTTVKTRLSHEFEKLLQQCDRNEIPFLEEQMRTSIAHRCRALNDEHSAFLKLPPELIVEIGRLVLGSSKHWGSCYDKDWFKNVLPLLQTCTHLRNCLIPLRLERLECRAFNFYEKLQTLWTNVQDIHREWHEKGTHKGVVVLKVAGSNIRTGASTLAAMAGALECQIYGRLLQPPAIFLELHRTDKYSKAGYTDTFYISHRCRAFMLKETYDYTKDPAETAERFLSVGENSNMWDEAEAEMLTY